MAIDGRFLSMEWQRSVIVVETIFPVKRRKKEAIFIQCKLEGDSRCFSIEEVDVDISNVWSRYVCRSCAKMPTTAKS